MKLVIATVLLLLATAPGPADEELDWKKPEATELYQRARDHFEKGEYRESAELWKDLKKLAGDRATKQHVLAYLHGCEGGLRLELIREQAQQGRKREAYGAAELAHAGYRETPIAPAYQSFLDGLRDELFTVLESFDRPGNRFSEKYGKSFIDDPEIVRAGERCLKWETQAKNVSLKIDDLPRNMTAHDAVSVWINFEKGTAPYRLVFACDAEDALYNAQKPHRGWRRIEVPFNEFIQQGACAWDTVKDFRIQFDGRPAITLYVDDVCLVKKSTPEPGKD